jgi:hypothetical protein
MLLSTTFSMIVVGAFVRSGGQGSKDPGPRGGNINAKSASCSKVPSRQPQLPGGRPLLAEVEDVDAVVNRVIDMCAGLAGHVNIDVDFDAGSAMMAAAAGHFVQVGLCQFDKFAKVIHS